VLNGVILAFGQWVFWGVFSGTAPELATLADPDWYAVSAVLVALGSVLEPIGAAAIWVVAGAVLAVSVGTLVALGRRSARAERRAATERPAADDLVAP
jgi:PTS system ascorbate-specific IIC component